MGIFLENILRKNINELKKNHDNCLRNKEEAYKFHDLGRCRDDDIDVIQRQIAFREGYVTGWREALKEKNRLDNSFILEVKQALIELLKDITIIDEYNVKYNYNNKNNNIIAKDKNNREFDISLETFLDYKYIKFKVLNKEENKHV